MTSPIPQTSMRIPLPLKQAVMAKAASEGRTLTDVTLAFYRDYVGERTVYDHLPLRGDCARSSTMDRCPQLARPDSRWCSDECEAKDREIGERWANLPAGRRMPTDDRCDKPVGNGWYQLSPGHEGDCGLPGPAPSPERPPAAVDLMAALRASVERARQARADQASED